MDHTVPIKTDGGERAGEWSVHGRQAMPLAIPSLWLTTGVLRLIEGTGEGGRLVSSEVDGDLQDDIALCVSRNEESHVV